MKSAIVSRFDGSFSGFSLIELLIAVALSSFLSLGLVRIASATLTGFRLQDSLAEILESGQLASDTIGNAVRSASFLETPWVTGSHYLTILPETLDNGIGGNDQLALMTRSDRNCFGSLNSDLDAAGYPRYRFKKTVIEIRDRTDLTVSCSYGEDEESMVLQVRRERMIRNVESLQLLFGEDIDSDQVPDRWVNAGAWSDESNVLAVRTGLLLVGEEPVGQMPPPVYSVLDQHLAPPADGKLRRLVEFTSAIRGRLP
jgi:prepilin-type N-terminal cleavage/methylation domain-containing protein